MARGFVYPAFEAGAKSRAFFVYGAAMPSYDGFKSQVREIPYGNNGIFVSVSHLKNFIRKGRRDPNIIRFTRRLVRNCPNKDYMCEARTVFNWVQNNIRFVRDPHNVEAIQGPEVTLRRDVLSGDCDDHVVLLQSMLQSIGIPTRIVLVASQKAAPNQYNHIFSEALVPVNGVNKWVSMDTTPITSSGDMASFGYMPRGFIEKREVVQ